MATIQSFTVDCAHPASLARFWEAVLDDFQIRPYDDAEIARLASLGLTPETDPGVMLDGADGTILCFQLVPEPKTTKIRMHLDLETPERAKEVARLLALGASVLEEFESRTVMLDPEGNEFCMNDL